MHSPKINQFVIFNTQFIGYITSASVISAAVKLKGSTQHSVVDKCDDEL